MFVNTLLPQNITATQQHKHIIAYRYWRNQVFLVSFKGSSEPVSHELTIKLLIDDVAMMTS